MTVNIIISVKSCNPSDFLLLWYAHLSSPSPGRRVRPETCEPDPPLPGTVCNERSFVTQIIRYRFDIDRFNFRTFPSELRRDIWHEFNLFLLLGKVDDGGGRTVSTAYSTLNLFSLLRWRMMTDGAEVSIASRQIITYGSRGDCKHTSVPVVIFLQKYWISQINKYCLNVFHLVNLT